MRKTKKWMTSFGAMEDNPFEFIRVAREQIDALPNDVPKGSLALRQAAEAAHLALSSAVEIATGKAIDQANEEFKRVKTLAVWLRDPAFPKDFNALRRTLHSDSFHGAKCTRSDVLVALGAADAMVTRILRAKRKAHKK